MDELNLVKLGFDIFKSKPVKAIKVTTEFSRYLAASCKSDMIYKKSDYYNGYIANFTGIPVVVDDTIDGYYELVF